ncbi:substrate-binding domain-containing protein [Litorihabitans aurantiacus]|uniref:Transcriptional regulator LacI/GalR-like sensor domain-containing protein n=1 Tax=Litorihabitans aurantiacus TaxID=1930061 RepID=A0AA37UNN0_9MICO|nr:substrate-binding domain-containing protein [Litorihabitans aurantiacus]GMA30428.1 hypothetical protein GCM10025875_04200 [Litorihabitans aurantiacus]
MLRRDSTGESVRDRHRGFLDELRRRDPAGDAVALDRALTGDPSQEDWAALRACGATVAFVETPGHALAIHAAAVRDGVAVPEQLSIVTLADPFHTADGDPDLTRLSPRARGSGRRRSRCSAASSTPPRRSRPTSCA